MLSPPTTYNLPATSFAMPVEFLDELGWREKQRVVVNKARGKLVISDWKPKRRQKR